MSRIVLLGVGPLPSPNLERVHAPGLRLRLFLDAIRLSGHSVFLVELPFGGQAAPHSPLYEKNIQSHRRLEGDTRRMIDQLEGWVREFEPDAIVALTDIGGLLASSINFRGPLWVDYFGHPLAERQQQAHAHGSNDSLADAWTHVLPALLRADHFSVGVPSQRLALVGELGVAGRLNSATCGHELVSVVDQGVSFPGTKLAAKSNYMQKIGIPAGARTILSSGGFNTWTDGETLFKAVEKALIQEPDLHFVCTGGRIPGHVEVVYERFERAVGNSSVASRFHLLGWIQHEQLLDALASADVGINIDLNTLEGELGYRNRLLGWLQAGMRVVSTVVGEPARGLVADGLVREIPFADADAAAAALVEQARLGRWASAEDVRGRLQTRWSATRDTEAVVRFCDAPKVAPDRAGGRDVQNPLAELHRQSLLEHERQQGEVSARRFARDTGKRLLGSRMFGLAAYFNPKLKEMAERLSQL